MRKFFQIKAVKIALISLTSFGIIAITLQLFGLGLFTPAAANPTLTVINTLNEILYYLFIWPFSVIGGILAGILVEILKSPIKYVSMPAIIRAWMVVRDVANISFIISLLVVAFSTTLGIERYSYKKLLPRIIIMAVLVNFSRTICGIFTDFATVLMRSFSNAIGAGATGSLLATFGVTGWSSPSEGYAPNGDSVGEAGNMSLIIILIIGLLAVMCVTLAVWIVALVLRVVTIWFLVVLSPLTFALYAVPNGEKYYSDWWKQFGNAVILGPLIAFFFWLSLYIATISNTDGATSSGNRYGFEAEGVATLDRDRGEENFASNFQVTDPNTIINFVVAIMMMFTGLKISKQLSGEFGGVLNKVQGMATKGVKGYAKFAGKNVLGKGANYGFRAAVSPVTGVGMLGQWGASKIKNKTIKRLAGGAAGLLRLPNQIAKDRMEKSNKAQAKSVSNLMDKAGMGEGSRQLIADFADLPGKGRMGKFTSWATGVVGLKTVADGARLTLKEQATGKKRANNLNGTGGAAAARGLSDGQMYGIDGLDKRTYNMLDNIEDTGLDNILATAPANSDRHESMVNMLAGYKKKGGKNNSMIDSWATRNHLDSDIDAVKDTVEVAFKGDLNAKELSKHGETEEALAGDANFFASKEYKADQRLAQEDRKYASQDKYKEEKKGYDAMKKWNNSATKKENGFGRVGLGESEATVELAANFSDEALAGITALEDGKQGVNITGEAKKQAIPILVDKFMDNLIATMGGKISEDEIVERTEKFEADLLKADDIAMTNIGRKGGTSGDVGGHERAHTLARRMGPQERKRILKDQNLGSAVEEEEYLVDHIVSQTKGGAKNVRLPQQSIKSIAANPGVQAAQKGMGEAISAGVGGKITIDTGQLDQALKGLKGALDGFTSEGVRGLNNSIKDMQKAVKVLNTNSQIQSKKMQKDVQKLLKTLKGNQN